MVTFLITSLVILGVLAIAIYYWQKPRHQTEITELPPPPVTSLFANEEPVALIEAPAELSLADAAIYETEQRQTRKAAAEEFIERWKQSPDRNSTAQMLHLAAAADDAETYDKAAEAALSFWQNGQLPDLSATELQSLLNSEYWLLSSQTRSSGAGFVLKRTLSRAKRELETVNNPN